MMDANPDLSGPYMARQNVGATQQATADLDGILAGGQQNMAPGPKPHQTPSFMDRAATVAAKAPGDVGYGVVEAPKQVVGGIFDAVGNAAKGLDHLGDWFDAHLGGAVNIPSSGNSAIDAIGGAFLNPLGAVGNLSGAVGQAKTVTGGVIREGAKFLTGFLPAMRLARSAGLGTAAGSIVAGATAGATVLDPSAPNLTKTIADNVTVPASLKPAVDLLATNPSDPELVNRARNMVENAGFGMMAEGVFRGVQAISRARSAISGTAHETVVDPLAAAKAEYGEAKPEDFAILGDPEKPAVSVSAAKFDAAAKATDGRVSIPTDEGGQVYINFARINEPDDIKVVMDKMASAFKGPIDEAARGVQSNEATAKLADDLGMSVEDLLSRRQGQPFNAEESLAARRLWGASAQKLVETAEAAANPNAGAIDHFNFRKMMATHAAIQNEVIGARTETARALQAWSIPAGGGVEQARAIQQMLDGSGGGAISAQLAKRIASLKNAGVGQDGINAMVRKGWGATTMDAVREAYVTGLLWNPSTHIVNTMSNTIVAAQQIGERYAAEKISALRGDPNGVAPGEASAMSYGLLSSLRDAWTMSGKAMRTGETGASIGKTELPRERAISSNAFANAAGYNPAQTAAFKETGLGQAIDYIGFAGGIPGRLLASEDEFFKTIGYRMELHAQAVRTAAGEGLDGQDFANRVADVVNNPPENIRIASADAALYATFQNNPGDIVKALMTIRGKAGIAGTILLPFLKTPGNILTYTFERTPAAPLVGRWRADVAAGGARRDLALARMATGTSAMMTVLDMADSGLVSGAGPSKPEDLEALNRTGWQPYSFKVGDKWVSYQRTDPLGMMFGFAATTAEKMKQAEIAPEDLDEWQEALAAGVAVVSQTIVDKTFFQGLSNVVTAIQEAKQGPGSIESMLNQQAPGLVPFSSALNVAKRFTDPVTRQVMNPYDAIQARFPILSQDLPARRDLWGAPMKPDEVFGRTYDVLSPLYVRAAKDSPIDAEMVRLQAGQQRIGVKSSFDGVEVNYRDFPNVYDRYVRLAGNELKHPAWNLGAKDLLDQVVTGKSPLSGMYNRFSDEGKANMIKQTIEEYRQLAQREIKANPQGDEEKRFLDYVQTKKAAALAARLPQ